MGIRLTDQAMKMATPFGGGVGRSEDLCGAVAGGVLTTGIVLGRTDPTEDRLRSYDAAGKLHKRFFDEFGSTQCRTLNKSDFQSPAHRERCGRFVTEATRLAIEGLMERDER
jgi:C_GCAxxG_C_C family probable redox protein